MKHLKSYFQLYESNDNDYIGMILSNLSDTAPNKWMVRVVLAGIVYIIIKSFFV